MKITTNNILTSKLYPEVSYQVRSLSEGRRQQLLTSVADAQYRLYDLVGEANALLPAEGEQMDQQTVWKRAALINQIEELTSRVIHPQWVRIYVKQINNLEIDGEPATIETFLSDAPTDMFVECVELIKAQAELSDKEAKN